jgi:uncharacterized membrane protein
LDKKTYLTELAKELKILSKVEKDEVLADFDEHFAIASGKGRSESDIIQGLGAPRKVAKEILVQYEITKADANPSFNSVSTAVFAAVGLGMFNLLFVFVPFILVLTIPILLLGSAILFMLSPILLLIQDGFTFTYVKELFLMLGLVGFGLILLIGAIKFSSIMYKLVLKYLKFNLRMVGRKSA